MRFIFLLLLTFQVLAQDRYYEFSNTTILVPGIGSESKLSSHDLFSGFISNFFNRPGPYHGPNCYNAALIASGAYSAERLRYISQEEFEAVLKRNYQVSNEPQFGDIIVFDALASRDHAAFYLGDGLLFHKKSFVTSHLYRIISLEQVGILEKGEWQPNLGDDSAPQMNWPKLGALPKSFYRLYANDLHLDPRFEKIILQIEKALVRDLGKWEIGKRWGMLGEYLLQDLLDLAADMQTDDYTKGVLLSLKDQIFIMLDEVYFKRPRPIEKIYAEICIPVSRDEIISFVSEYGKLLRKDDKAIKAALYILLNQDRSRCLIRPSRAFI